jgi:hypothetical protein
VLRTTSGQIFIHEKKDSGGNITLLSPTVMTKLDCESIQTSIGYTPKDGDFVGWKESVIDDDFITLYKYEWKYGDHEA